MILMELSAEIHFERGSYWAEVPDLPGCFAAGDTLDELFASLREGMELYLRNGVDSEPVRPLQLRSAVLSDAGGS
jgi:predicted RNase H-like HicB family nuclease